MGQSPPPRPLPKVLVPPLFDSIPLAARNKMMESTYNLLFGKFAMRSLFDDYFEDPNRLTTRIMLKPIDDNPRANFFATVAVPLDHKPDDGIVGNAQFRVQTPLDPREEENLNFLELCVSNTAPTLLIKSCMYDPELGIGVFCTSTILRNERVSPRDLAVVGIKCNSANASAGATITTFYRNDGLPRSLWYIRRIGRLTAGVQYEAKFRGKGGELRSNLANWSGAVAYGSPNKKTLMPSYNFAFELKNGDLFVASFYQRMVVQRRIRNPFEKNGVVGITNYIDLGFEMQMRVDGAKSQLKINKDPSFQVAASWQANKNILVKGKFGPLGSSIALAFKSWWKPALTFNVSAVRDRSKGETSFGFGFHVDNIRKASYQRANPHYVMVTPDMEHLAEGRQWNIDQ